jgi:hypothetical protein
MLECNVIHFAFYHPGILPFGNAVLCAFWALLIWIRQVKSGGLTFGFLLLPLAVWSLAAALEEGSSDFDFKHICAKLSYLGIGSAPALLAQGVVMINNSWGLSSMGTCSPDLHHMIHCADQALSEAKKAGRDQVKCFNSGEKLQEQKQGIALIKKFDKNEYYFNSWC